MPNGKPEDKVEDPRKDEFPELTKYGDPALRLVAWLIKNKDFRQLEQRTGIPERKAKQASAGAKSAARLPVLLQLEAKNGKVEIRSELHEKYGVPQAYAAAIERNPKLTHVTGRLRLDADIVKGFPENLRKAVSALGTLGVKRICLGAPGQPSRKRETHEDINLPASRKYDVNKPALTGDGVIVGIIDDGCALAHNNFLKKRVAGGKVESRILYLWDQGAETVDTSVGWTVPAGFGGREIRKQKIDDALNAHKAGDLIQEGKVYEYLGYKPGEVATHGTHVMDIATGNGQAMMGLEGVAPDADIVFVQLPTAAMEGGATVLSPYILEGVAYVFDRASKEGRPAVVNISFGGYDGPHDGTSELERKLDQMLAEPERAIVLAAGNGFEERCHAVRDVPRNGTAAPLRWIVPPHDPTANDLEIWYEGKLQVRLTPPRGAIDPGGWVPVPWAKTPITAPGDTKAMGFIEHLPGGTDNNANRIVIHLNGMNVSGTDVPAPSGTWTVELEDVSGQKTVAHAWIWRDDAGRARNTRRMQSRFHPDDAHPAHTISGWATGHLTISVGAYNLATREICRYSASGPTAPTGKKPNRAKPEIYAPAEEDARGRGVLAASALSARPRRMKGTSAAAPHITGLIALMFEYARKHPGGALQLKADDISRELQAAAKKKALELNRHQKVDNRVPIKQKDVRAHLEPTGKGDFVETMKKLPQ